MARRQQCEWRHETPDKAVKDGFYGDLCRRDLEKAVETKRIAQSLPDCFINSELSSWKAAPAPQERSIAIAPSWVQLEDEVVNHQTTGKPGAAFSPVCELQERLPCTQLLVFSCRQQAGKS